MIDEPELDLTEEQAAELYEHDHWHGQEPDVSTDAEIAPDVVVASSSCEQQYQTDTNNCELWFDERADFACCMSHATCYFDAKFDRCDCLYAIGSAAHQTCANQAAAWLNSRRQQCINGFFGGP